MRPEPLHGFGACFSLAQCWFARRGAGCLVLVRVHAPDHSLVMSGLRAGVRVLSRDEFRESYSVGAASLGILKFQVFLEQPQEVPVGFFDLFADKTPEEPAEAQLTAYVQGKVQGVGFRWWCAGAAKPLGLSGYAENLDDGRVKVIAQGSRASCERLLETLNSGDTAGHVDFVDASFSEPQGTFKGFGTR